MDIPDKTLDSKEPIADLVDLLQRAFLSGNPDHYDPDDPDTHPHFDQDLECAPPELLMALIKGFGDIFQAVDWMLRQKRQVLPWGKEGWDFTDLANYREVQEMQTKSYLIWHLQKVTERILEKNMKNFVIHCAENLRLTQEGFDTIVETYQEKILLVLAAGWTPKDQAEA